MATIKIGILGAQALSAFAAGDDPAANAGVIELARQLDLKLLHA